MVDAERPGSGNCGTYLRHGRAYAPPFASFLIEQIRFRLRGHAALPLQDRVFQRNRPEADIACVASAAAKALSKENSIYSLAAAAIPPSGATWPSKSDQSAAFRITGVRLAWCQRLSEEADGIGIDL